MGIESALPAGNNDDNNTTTSSALLSCGLCCTPLHPPLLPYRFPCCKKHICTDCKVEYESSDHGGQSHKCPYCRTQYRPEPLRPQPEGLGDRSPGPPTPRAAFETAMERQILAQRAAREAAGGQGEGDEEGEEDEGEGGAEGGRMRRRWRRLREGVRRRLGRGRRGGEEEGEGEGEQEE